MILINKEIVEKYDLLKEAFNDNSKYFPAKISFIIQKNIKKLKELSQEIYTIRDNIVKNYGTLENEEEGLFSFSEEVRGITQKELDDLLEVEQEVNILKLKFKDIEDLEFTSNQMEALMFMIDEEDQAE